MLYIIYIEIHVKMAYYFIYIYTFENNRRQITTIDNFKKLQNYILHLNLYVIYSKSVKQ